MKFSQQLNLTILEVQHLTELNNFHEFQELEHIFFTEYRLSFCDIIFFAGDTNLISQKIEIHFSVSLTLHAAGSR